MNKNIYIIIIIVLIGFCTWLNMKNITMTNDLKIANQIILEKNEQLEKYKNQESFKEVLTSFAKNFLSRVE